MSARPSRIRSRARVPGRGYAIVEGADGRVRSDAVSLRPGALARLRMRDGRAHIRIVGVEVGDGRA